MNASIRARARSRWGGLRLIARVRSGRCAGNGFRFLRDLCQVQDQILLLSAPCDRDVRLRGRTQRAKNLLAMLGIVERCSIDRRDEIAGTQTETHERLAIAARINAIACLLAVGKHRLRPHHVSQEAGLFRNELAHAVRYGAFRVQHRG